MKRQISKTLLELWIGEVIFGLACQIIGVFFVNDKGAYSIGLWIGVVASMIGAYHMWYTLDVALDLDEKQAGKMMSSNYMIRYVMIIIIMLITYYTRIGNVFATFLGYMGLKAGAFLQPFVHKIISSKKE